MAYILDLQVGDRLKWIGTTPYPHFRVGDEVVVASVGRTKVYGIDRPVVTFTTLTPCTAIRTGAKVCLCAGHKWIATTTEVVLIHMATSQEDVDKLPDLPTVDDLKKFLDRES